MTRRHRAAAARWLNKAAARPDSAPRTGSPAADPPGWADRPSAARGARRPRARRSRWARPTSAPRCRCSGRVKKARREARSMILPRYITAMSSQMCSTTAMSCEMNRKDWPRSRWIRRSRFRICARMAISSADTGSSQTIRSGPLASARATFSRRWPPENWCGYSACWSCRRPTSSNISATRARARPPGRCPSGPAARARCRRRAGAD